MSVAHNNPFAPTDRMLRQFSLLWIIFLGAIAGLQEFYYDRPIVAGILALLAVTVGPLGLAWPATIRPIFIGWMALAYPIGWVVSRVILGILFFGMFAPVALIFRIIGRDAMGLKRQSRAATYWRPKPQARSSAQYLRQF